VAPGAPPSPFRPAWGFPRRAYSRDVSSERPSPGVQLPFGVRPLACRPLSFSAPSRRPPKKTATGAFRECGIRLSWVSYSHEHNDAGCPVRRASPRRVAVGEGSPIPRRCRPQGSCPSRRFWLHFTTQRAPRETRRRSRRPDAWRPCFMPLAFPESPFRASHLSRSRARSRGPRASLRVRVRPLPDATCSRDSRPLSAPRRPLAAARPLGLTGRRSRDDVSSRPLRRSVVRTAKRADRDRHTPCTPGSPVGGRHARFEALLPPRGPCSRRPLPWPG